MDKEIQQAWNDLQAVPSYFERPMSQDEEEDLYYQWREEQERTQIADEVEQCWQERAEAA